MGNRQDAVQTVERQMDQKSRRQLRTPAFQDLLSQRVETADYRPIDRDREEDPRPTCQILKVSISLHN